MHPLVAPLVPAVQARGGITTWLPIVISGLALLFSSTMSILSYLNSRWSYKLAKAKDHAERGPKWECSLDEVDGHLRWLARMTDGPPRVYVYYRISGHFYPAKRDAPGSQGEPLSSSVRLVEWQNPVSPNGEISKTVGLASVPDPAEVHLQLELLSFLPGQDQKIDQGWFFPVELRWRRP